MGGGAMKHYECFYVMYCNVMYPTYILRLSQGRSRLSFVEIFGTRKPDSLSYRVALLE